jgi:small subunit ribosomal protein S5
MRAAQSGFASTRLTPDMAETLDATSSLESTTVGVYRTAATVKGGRRFSFSALVVVGDRHGSVGIGYGKANQVPQAIEKAQKVAKRRMKQYPMTGRTIPHAVTGRFGACLVRLLPASPGTGVIAGAATRAPLEMMGVQDCLTKSLGSNNPKNLVKAVINGFEQLRSKELIQSLRGVEIGKTDVEEAIERGQAFMPASTSGGERAVAPVNVVGQDKGGGRGGRGGRGGGGGRGGRRSHGPDAAATGSGDAGGSDSGSGDSGEKS